MTKSQKNLLHFLGLLRDAHCDNSKPKGWYYHGPADLLLREGEWFDSKRGGVLCWEHSMFKACFRNAALYAMQHKGYRYIEGYATSIIPVHHAWCLDPDDRVIELTWKELGSDYFGIQFQPKLVLRGAVLFNPSNSRIYKRRRKPRKNLKGIAC